MRIIERYKFDVKPQLPDNRSDFGSLMRRSVKLIKDGYDLVFCVVDLDYIVSDQTNKTNYSKKKKELKKKYSNLIFIETMPCIEFWFLLHFYEKYSTRIYTNYNSLEPELKKCLPDYEKSDKYFKCKNIYQALKDSNKIEKAINYAERLLIDRKEADNELFPFTEIHSLIIKLKEIDNRN